MATKKKTTSEQPNGNALIAQVINAEENFSRLIRDDPPYAWWIDAIESTEFSRNEAAVVQWLTSDDPERFPGLRERFTHRLRGVDDVALAKVSALISRIVDALVQNDSEAIEHAAEFWDEYVGLGNQLQRIQSVLGMWEPLVAKLRKDPEALRTNPDQFHGDIEMFRLAAMTIDGKFEGLDNTLVLKTVARIRLNSSGGARNLRPRGALARLFVACGAFGFTDKRAAKNKIDTAAKGDPEVAAKPKTRASRA